MNLGRSVEGSLNLVHFRGAFDGPLLYHGLNQCLRRGLAELLMGNVEQRLVAKPMLVPVRRKEVNGALLFPGSGEPFFEVRGRCHGLNPNGGGLVAEGGVLPRPDDLVEGGLLTV